MVWDQPNGQLLQQSVCRAKEFLHKPSEIVSRKLICMLIVLINIWVCKGSHLMAPSALERSPLHKWILAFTVQGKLAGSMYGVKWVKVCCGQCSMVHTCQPSRFSWDSPVLDYSIPLSYRLSIFPYFSCIFNLSIKNPSIRLCLLLPPAGRSFTRMANKKNSRRRNSSRRRTAYRGWSNTRTMTLECLLKKAKMLCKYLYQWEEAFSYIMKSEGQVRLFL